MAPAMQMTQSIQTFDRESQAYEEPVEKQAVGVVMGDIAYSADRDHQFREHDQ